ncbi:hypothetical protein B6D60_02985 [candidate division KSB1 bacterium 4484_87]|nr:MAG: hypothetical protein B6D60_02985 [candidate division KSB1 bacterium 4484_87]
MRKTIRTLLIVTSIFALLLSVFLTGCTRHPNEKQCQAYEEQVKATDAAEQALQDKKQEKATVEQQLNDAKQKLEEVKSEKSTIQSKLGGM